MDRLHRCQQYWRRMAQLTTLIMSPVLAEKPWGGRRLENLGKELPDGLTIGESWEVADLPQSAVTTVDDPRSRVATGVHRNKTLRRLIAEFGGDLLGSAPPTPEGDFPLLVKLLDAREHLSIQVHPDAAFVADHPDARLKTESWYVVAAAPDSHLYLGLRAGVTAADVAARVGTPGIVGLLQTVPAVPGDFHHLPAGLVHALGAGVLVAEVQTPSDTTFRIYDWEDRYDRPPRTMHGAAALEAIRPELGSEPSHRPDGPGSRDLTTGSDYWIREHRCSGGSVELDRRPEVRVLMVVSGALTIAGEVAGAGTTVVVPASLVGEVAVVAAEPTVVLEIGLA